MGFDGLNDAAALEAHACNEALALATDVNLTRSLIASDCLDVVNKIGTAATITMHLFCMKYQKGGGSSTM